MPSCQRHTVTDTGTVQPQQQNATTFACFEVIGHLFTVKHNNSHKPKFPKRDVVRALARTFELQLMVYKFSVAKYRVGEQH